MTTTGLRVETDLSAYGGYVNKRVWIFWLTVTITTGVVERWSLAWAPVAAIFKTFMPDDAFYYFTIARNIAGGRGSTGDGTTLTNGYHPLWMALLSAIYAVSGRRVNLPIHVALTVAGVADVFTCLLIFTTVSRLSKSVAAGVCAAALYFLNPYAALTPENGLETSLSLLFFAASVWWYVRLRDGDEPYRSSVILGCLAGLTLLARSDYIFFVLALNVDALRLYLKTRRRLRNIALQNIATFAVLLPWLGWSLARFGTIMQVSGEAYPYYLHRIWMAHGGTYLSPGFLKVEADLVVGIGDHLARFSGLGRLLPLFSLGAVVLFVTAVDEARRREYARSVVGLWFVAAGALLPPLINGLLRWMILPWYFASSMFLLPFAVGMLIPHIRKEQLRITFVILVGLIGWYSFQYVQLRHTGWFETQAAAVRQGLPDVIRMCSHERVLGISDSGYYSYYAPCAVVNLDGVVNNEAYLALKQNRFVDYLRSRQIRYVALNPTVYQVVSDKRALRKDGRWYEVLTTTSSK